MIKSDELSAIGELFKPHGIKGEISARLAGWLLPDDLRCIVLDVDGIFVPFFISSWRPRGSEGAFLLKLDGVDSAEDALKITPGRIYGIRAELPEPDDAMDDYSDSGLEDLIGFKILNKKNEIGTVVDVDDSTENILLNVQTPDGKIILLPFAEGLIEKFDYHNREIVMSLPSGILDLN